MNLRSWHSRRRKRTWRLPGACSPRSTRNPEPEPSALDIPHLKQAQQVLAMHDQYQRKKG